MVVAGLAFAANITVYSFAYDTQVLSGKYNDNLEWTEKAGC